MLLILVNASSKSLEFIHHELELTVVCMSSTYDEVDSDTLMAARSQPNDNWGSVGNGAKHGERYVGGGSGM